MKEFAGPAARPLQGIELTYSRPQQQGTSGPRDEG